MDRVWTYDDGGRAAAGFQGEARDCVTRAIAIATGIPYREIYDQLHERAKLRRGRSAERDRKSSPRLGVRREVYEPLLADLGWRWTPTMQIGSGCTVHLRADELPGGRLVVAVSRHVVAVIDGVVHDTHDSTREGTRCVYGFYVHESGPPVRSAV